MYTETKNSKLEMSHIYFKITLKVFLKFTRVKINYKKA